MVAWGGLAMRLPGAGWFLRKRPYIPAPPGGEPVPEQRGRIRAALAMKTNSQLEQDRVRRQTSDSAAEAIDEKTRRHIRLYGVQPRHELDRRIAEVERERDMEEVLETNASILALSGAILGTTVNKNFFLITGTVLGFLTQHAITGWCPPVPIFRRIGVRTRAEIDQEKYALKALRGDFKNLRGAKSRADVASVWKAVNT